MKVEIEDEFRIWIKEKLKVKSVLYMCYAIISFDKQRQGIHELCSDLAKSHLEIYKELSIFKYIICGWADDLTKILSLCFPDFMDKFGKGISIKRIFEITQEEMGNES